MPDADCTICRGSGYAPREPEKSRQACVACRGRGKVNSTIKEKRENDSIISNHSGRDIGPVVSRICGARLPPSTVRGQGTEGV